MNWWLDTAKIPSEQAQKVAEARQLQLTKPTGSLSELERIAVQLASLQDTLPKSTMPNCKLLIAARSVKPMIM